jgi:hypothetical protein
VTVKYKVVANQVIMEEGISALHALNCVCNLMKANLYPLVVEIFYRSEKNGEPSWKLENKFEIIPQK